MTLLEVLTATTILGFIAAGIFTAFVFGRRITTMSESRLVALGFAQQTAEELRLQIGSATLNAGTYTVALPANNPLAKFGGTRTYTVRNGRFNPDGTIDWITATDTNYDIKEVTIRVTWTPPAAQ